MLLHYVHSRSDSQCAWTVACRFVMMMHAFIRVTSCTGLRSTRPRKHVIDMTLEPIYFVSYNIFKYLHTKMALDSVVSALPLPNSYVLSDTPNVRSIVCDRHTNTATNSQAIDLFQANRKRCLRSALGRRRRCRRRGASPLERKRGAQTPARIFAQFIYTHDMMMVSTTIWRNTAGCRVKAIPRGGGERRSRGQ